MSQDDQDAILGRTMREIREAKERLERLKAEATRRGNKLKDIGHYLAGYPEHMVREGEFVDSTFLHKTEGINWKDSDLLLPETLSELTSSIRKELITLADLDKRLKNLGH